MKPEDTSGYVQSVRIQNSRGVPVKFHLEPWGDQYEMAPNIVFEVVAKAANQGALEIVLGDEHLTVWGWTGSVISVFKEGVELGAGKWKRQPVPPYPPQVT